MLSVMTTPDSAYRWWFRDPLTKILFKGTFGKIGVKNLGGSTTRRSPIRRSNSANDCCGR